MCINPLRQRGVTLIELIVAIVIVSVALVGVYSVLNLTLLRSADPVIYKQMLSIAEGMMDEILLKSFADPGGECTPTTSPRCQLNSTVDRPNYNDVDDYAGFVMNGVSALDGSAVAGLENYRVAVTVDPATTLGGLSGANVVKRVVVTVTYGAESLSLEGYRTNFDG